MMARRLGLFGVLLAWTWLGGCFSGGEVVGEDDFDGGLDPEDVAVGQDTTDARTDSTRSADSDSGGCEHGWVECDGTCVDSVTSTEHCGDCSVVCEVRGANTQPICSEGVCGQNCTPGWSDGDGDSENGCELECEATNDGDEICDGVDNDCNGIVDDGFSTGACTVGTGACETSGQYVCVDDDTAECNVTPGAPTDEVCADGVDNDCDGAVDEDDAVDASSWFADGDGDGFGDAAVSVRACERPDGYVDNDTDCDDTDVSAHTEVDGFADQDGDGYTDGGLQTLCTDGALPSGYVASKNGQDCDDTRASTNPGADEKCGDGVDNDCDGDTDDASAVDTTTWYIDCDGDGYAADTSGHRVACTEPAVPAGCSSAQAGWTERLPVGDDSTDCNDSEADAFPGQTAWFSSPMSALYFNEKWDYDCDGYVDFEFTDHSATCSSSCATFNGDSAGWVQDYNPSCGQSRSYQRCYIDIHVGTCDNGTMTRTQACH
jgi:hypothetical protein